MRTILLTVALAISSFAPAAAIADTPASVPQLAPGEVLLSVNGLGNVRSPATLATVSGSADARGTTEAETRRALQAKVGEMTAAARAAGATADDIRVSEETISAVDTDIYTADMADPTAEPRREQPRFFGRATVTVRLRNASRAQALYARFGGYAAGGYYFGGGGPIYELIDESGPRRAARAQAIANARADAESYAAPLNMRIVRVVHVTEREGLDFLSMTVSESNALIRAMRSFSSAQAEAQVETYAIVGVDFVLGPR
ncbi:MAG TPA: SIMPL domain-containing protein [Allosphingosinicella sp.]|nr:SIMPL domain-containing protein [Allosphingosinicella sp.]